MPGPSGLKKYNERDELSKERTNMFSRQTKAYRELPYMNRLAIKVLSFIQPLVSADKKESPEDIQFKVHLFGGSAMYICFNIAMVILLATKFDWEKPETFLNACPFVFMVFFEVLGFVVLVTRKTIANPRRICAWGTLIGMVWANFLAGGMSQSKSLDTLITTYPLSMVMIFPVSFELVMVTLACLCSTVVFTVLDHIYILEPTLQLPASVHGYVWLSACIGLTFFVAAREIEFKELKRESEEVRVEVQVLTEKNAFVSVLSHEIRTPLNAMIGVLSVFKGDNCTEEQLKHLQVMCTASEGMLRIITDILDHHKIDGGNFTLNPVPGEIRGIVGAITDLHESLCQAKNVTQCVRISPDVPAYISCDPLRLQQCITNLLSNACKFAKHGSTIEVSLDVVIECGNQMLKFAVQDECHGIPENKRNLLWKPYSQLSETIAQQHGGTGLGLSIVKKLVEMMQGHVKYEPKETCGVTGGCIFSFTHPLVIVERPSHANSSMESNRTIALHSFGERRETHQYGFSLLVVDDNQMNWHVMRNFSEMAGCSAVYACNGAEAVRIVKQEQEEDREFDIIFMDMWMPVMCGKEASIQIKAMGVSSTIIGLTADVMQSEATLEEVDAVLHKPIRPTTFIAKLEERSLGFSQDLLRVATVTPHPFGLHSTDSVLVMSEG